MAQIGPVETLPACREEATGMRAPTQAVASPTHEDSWAPSARYVEPAFNHLAPKDQQDHQSPLLNKLNKLLKLLQKWSG